MDIITDSVDKLDGILQRSGCEETGVRLDVDPGAKNCQYERGACMTASFGGRTAEFVTDDPIRALTKISFMIGAPLETPNVRSAACAIINVVTAFFCLSRVRRACPVVSHAPCLNQLAEELAGRSVFCIGNIPALKKVTTISIVDNIQNSDIIVVNNEGIIDKSTGDLVATWTGKKRIVFLGPSTSGVCRLQQGEHWCPYGQPMPDFVPDPSR